MSEKIYNDNITQDEEDEQEEEESDEKDTKILVDSGTSTKENPKMTKIKKNKMKTIIILIMKKN